MEVVGLEIRQKEVLERVFGIRAAEQIIIREYHKDEMKTPMHMSWGEEACVVGIYSAFETRPLVFGTYRSHALYLAATGDFEGFFGELLGKETGSSRGRAGSMHLARIDLGVFPSSAIVGGNISVAVGAGFTQKLKGRSDYTLAFFGDGAADSGTFWESLNIASALGIPVIFACLDNELAVHTPEKTRRSFKTTDFSKLGDLLGIPTLRLDSQDAFSVAESMTKFLATLQGGPGIVVAKWHRHLEHVGISTDYDAGYRSAPERSFLAEHDPVVQTSSRALGLGWSRDRLSELESEVNKKAQDGYESALLGVESEPSTALDGVYA